MNSATDWLNELRDAPASCFYGGNLGAILNSEWFTWLMIALDVVVVGYLLLLVFNRPRRFSLKSSMSAAILLKFSVTLMVTGEFCNDYHTFVVDIRESGDALKASTVIYACQLFHNDLILIPIDQLAVFIVLFASVFILLRGHQKLGDG